jgi:hypothetical protein
VFQSTARGFASVKCIDFQSSDLLLIYTEQKESVIANFVFVLCCARESQKYRVPPTYCECIYSFILKAEKLIRILQLFCKHVIYIYIKYINIMYIYMYI